MTRGPRGTIRWDDEAIYRQISEAPSRADFYLTACIERQHVRSEAYMRLRAPWNDDTGNARAGLHAATERLRLIRYAVILAHTVSYGIYLETRHGGRYRIIEPSLRHGGDELMRDVSRLFAEIFQ